MPSVSACSQCASGWSPVSASTVRCNRSTNSASWPASSTRLLPTSSSGSVDADPGVRVVGHRDAGQDPVDAETPGVVHEVDADTGCRCSWSKPQRTFACRTQRVTSSRSSSVKPKRARTGAACARLSTSLAVTRLPASASSCDATPSSGLVWTSERSASRTRSRCAGMRAAHHVAEPEVGVDQRRVGLDVGAHHQDVARLQRRVVGEQAEQHLAQHVDLSGLAVAACTCTERSPLVERAPLRPNGIGGDVGLQPAEQGVRIVRVSPAQVFVGLQIRAAGCAAARAGPGRGWPAADGRPRGGWCRRGGRWRRARPASARQRSSLGCGSHRCTSWWVASASSSSISVTAAGCARTATAAAAGRAAIRAGGQRSSAAGRAAGRRRCASTSARHSGGCQSRSASRSPGVAVAASRRAAAAAAWRRTRTARRAGARRRSAGPGAAPLLAGRRSGRGGWPACGTTARRGTRRSPRAAATPWRRAPTGRRRRCR